MFKAKKMFGQNFLIDRNVAAKIVKMAELEDGEQVWEIGPGKGILTEELLSTGCHLTCFEIDRELIPQLEKRFGKRINLISQDVLRVNWAEIIYQLEKDEKINSKIVMVANIPYNITSPLLYKITEYARHFSRIVLMIQKEVAERLVSSPGTKNYGVLSLKVQFHFTVKKLFRVQPHLFRPQPTVESVVIKLIPREDSEEICDLKFFWQIVEAAFHLRRKTLKNNLGSILTRQEIELLNGLIERGSITTSGSSNPEHKKPLRFNLSSRGESLDEKDFIDLYHLIRTIRSLA